MKKKLFCLLVYNTIVVNACLRKRYQSTRTIYIHMHTIFAHYNSCRIDFRAMVVFNFNSLFERLEMFMNLNFLKFSSSSHFY